MYVKFECNVLCCFVVVVVFVGLFGLVGVVFMIGVNVL